MQNSKVPSLPTISLRKSTKNQHRKHSKNSVLKSFCNIELKPMKRLVSPSVKEKIHWTRKTQNKWGFLSVNHKSINLLMIQLFDLRLSENQL